MVTVASGLALSHCAFWARISWASGGNGRWGSFSVDGDIGPLVLQVQARSDDYHQTKEFMNITKNFVTKQLKEEFEVSKTDQIDFLNRSVEYFKNNESYNREEFENEIFNNPDVIDSFRDFDQRFREDNNIEINDEFGISNQAVKKQARIFKSVLKLDKNFHIYVHGNRSYIRKGFDEESKMSFYQLFYKEES